MERKQNGGKCLAYLAIGDVPPATSLHWFRCMEAAMARLGLPARVNPRTQRHSDFARVVSKLRLNRRIATLSGRAYIVPMMQPSEQRFFPVSYFAEVIPYCFDVWPPRWDRWEAMFRRHRVCVAFFTARQAADEFRRRIPALDAVWIPEATDPTFLHPDKPLAARKIDVLELGRKYDAYHDAIAPRLAAAGRVHRFEAVKGQMIFDAASYDALARGYGDAKVSVCFPGSITHPQRSGHVETVTMRYYESMASRCLVVGHCPAELKDDFGYDPVVPADLNNPADQLDHVLANIDQYQPLVDRNHRTVVERATWDARFRQILTELGNRGYGK